MRFPSILLVFHWLALCETPPLSWHPANPWSLDTCSEVELLCPLAWYVSLPSVLAISQLMEKKENEFKK